MGSISSIPIPLSSYFCVYTSPLTLPHSTHTPHTHPVISPSHTPYHLPFASSLLFPPPSHSPHRTIPPLTTAPYTPAREHPPEDADQTSWVDARWPWKTGKHSIKSSCYISLWWFEIMMWLLFESSCHWEPIMRRSIQLSIIATEQRQFNPSNLNCAISNESYGDEDCGEQLI